jgi:BirA family biotin operon repressor/biotin-[acetyl-CoA-carboxylase] ligase
VGEAIAGLRDAGYEIDERPTLGYRLLAAPDRLIAADLRSRLGDTRFIRDILVFEETDSTNERLMQLGTTGALGGLVLFAEHQTAGRGRFSRQWASASHTGLWFSLLLRPDFPLALWPRLTAWTAVAVAEAVERSTGLEIRIKWPNDLVLNELKFAGILIETATDTAGQMFAVVGIGLNANHEPEDFPEMIRASATSLRIASRQLLDRPSLAVEVLRSLADWYPRLNGDFPAILAEARRRSTLLGRTVALQTAGERVEGIAEGLADDGRLVLRLPDGRLETFGAGEATVIPA